MIERLKLKNTIDVYDLILRMGKNQDFYITENKRRIFITELKLIQKLLKYQEIYGLFDKGLQGIFLIYREKGFRPYLRFLVGDKKVAKDLLKFVLWNYKEELFCKVRKDSILIEKIEFQRNLKSITYYTLLKSKPWKFKGDRGMEVLFYKERFIKKEEKDDSRHNSKD